MLRNNIYLCFVISFFSLRHIVKMDYVLGGIIEKRKKISEDDEDEYEEPFRGRRRKIMEEVCNEDDLVELAGAFVVASRPRKRRRRGRKIERDKSWWRMGTFHGMMRYFFITCAFHVPLLKFWLIL